MLNKLKKGIIASQTQRMLEKMNVDKSHELITNRSIDALVSRTKNPKQKNQLLNELYKKLYSDDPTLRIKTLVVMHACLRNSFDQEFVDVIENYQITNSSSKHQLRSYLQNNTINFYLMYLKKICTNCDSYNFVRKFCYSQHCQSHEKITVVAHGFKILNLMNFILQSQEMFNKMGRYHLDHCQILNMYLQMLQDLDYFNRFIKNSVNSLIINGYVKKIDRKSLRQIETCPSKDEFLSNEEAEETKHYFLFLNQAQKTSDRLYEFYHNRYYYKTLRSMITFPTFLQIDIKDYNRLRSKTKAVDRDLVRLVKESKYDRCMTQKNIQNQTFSHSVNHLSQGCEMMTTENTGAYSFINWEFSHGSRQSHLEVVADD